MGFRRKESSSSSTGSLRKDPNVIWNQVGIPAPDPSVQDALLEANYAAYYGSDTFNGITSIKDDSGKGKTFDDILGTKGSEPKSMDQTYRDITARTPWPGKFEPPVQSNWSNVSSTSDQYRSHSDAGYHAPRVDLPPRSKSETPRPETIYNVDLTTPWNPAFPPYSKYHTRPTASYTAAIEEESEDEGDPGVSRPAYHQAVQHRLSELIDPNDFRDEQDPYGSFPGASSYLGYSSSSSSEHSSRSSSFDYSSSSRSSSRSRTTPPLSLGNSRAGSRKPSFADSLKPLPPVLESPSGTLFSTTEFVAHPNRPLAIRERQEHIRAAIESLDAQNRAARSESRKGSVELGWKTGFGNDSRKGSMSGFGSDSRSVGGGMKTLEQMKIEEGRRAYEEKMARKGSGGGLFSALRGRKGSG